MSRMLVLLPDPTHSWLWWVSNLGFWRSQWFYLYDMVLFQFKNWYCWLSTTKKAFTRLLPHQKTEHETTNFSRLIIWRQNSRTVMLHPQDCTCCRAVRLICATCFRPTMTSSVPSAALDLVAMAEKSVCVCVCECVHVCVCVCVSVCMCVCVCVF